MEVFCLRKLLSIFKHEQVRLRRWQLNLESSQSLLCSSFEIEYRRFYCVKHEQLMPFVSNCKFASKTNFLFLFFEKRTISSSVIRLFDFRFSNLRLLSSKPATTTVLEIQEPKGVSPPSPTPSTVSSSSSRSSESEFMANPSSPNSVRLYLPKPRIPVQRRATITGASPVSKHAPLSLEQVCVKILSILNIVIIL